MSDAGAVVSTLNFMDRQVLEAARQMGVLTVDYRKPQPGRPQRGASEERLIRDARPYAADFSLDTSGFTLVHRPSTVRDWFDSEEVIAVYYEECRALAREMTGASHAFTFDHVIREPGRQTGGGSRVRTNVVTTGERGGGYVSGVHMDYTDASEWREYLGLHGISEPIGASRVVVLNFWRPIFDTADRDPLALCDARTVSHDDLLQTMLYGYGHEGYSWHDIGISVFQVASSPRQAWWYYSGMQPDEVLLIKTYDSLGVIGRGCPHASFTNPAVAPGTPPRRSIELRVLCYIDANDD